MGMSSGHSLTWDRLVHENIQVQGGEVVCSRSATEPARFWCSRLWPGDGSVSLSCWKLARFSYNQRARRGGSVRLQHAEHHLAVRPGWPAIPITTSLCFPELPPCSFLLPVRSLRVKAQMRKHARLQHFVAPQIPHITPLHLASQLNTNCSQNSSSAVPTDAPVLYLTEGTRLSFSIHIAPKLPVVFCFSHHPGILGRHLFVTTECSWMGMKGPVWREHGDRDCWETAGTELQVVVGDRIEFISSASQLSAPNPPLQSWSHEGNPRSGVLY